MTDIAEQPIPTGGTLSRAIAFGLSAGVFTGGVCGLIAASFLTSALAASLWIAALAAGGSFVGAIVSIAASRME